MMAVLGVVTGFFAGLALGAILLDRPIRAARDPRLAYGALETAIAAWALASIWLLPALGDLLAAAIGPTPPKALLWLAGFGLPALALLPATACMGGTLIALERLVGAWNGGRVVAGLYGANTAGAMAGCFACVFLLMPAWGLSGTLAALAVVNLFCALGALACRHPGAAAVTGSGRAGLRVGLTLVGTGLLGIALELLVIRLAAQVLQNTIYSFAILLGAYLLGTALGGLLWQRSRRPPTPAAIATLLAASSAACLLTALSVAVLGPIALAAGPGGLGWEFAVAGLLFLAPSAVMGALFGCLAQAFRDQSGSLGWALALNGLGAAAAAPLTTLVLIPVAGAASAVAVVGLGFLAFIAVPARPALRLVAAPLALAGLALLLRPAAPLVRVPEGGALLQTLEGPTATASVVTDAGATRYLEVNGHFRMGGTSSQRSDWRQAQIPLLLHPAPHRALFLGVGTGATLTGAAALPGISAIGVELVPEVVDLLGWFAEPGAPKLPPIVTADARRFVRADRDSYDVIVADLFHPALDGSGALYTVEHFAAVKARLAASGIFCQWLPLYQLDRASLDSILRSFEAVFPHATAWLAHFSLQTPMLALIGAPDGLPLDPARLERRLADPAAQPALRRTGLQRPLDLLGLFVGGAETIAALAGPGPANTDDRPFVALDARRNVDALAAPPSALLIQLLHAAAAGPGTGAIAARTAAYLRARDRFIEAGAAVPDGLDERGLMNAAIPGLLDSLRLSPDFDPAYWPLLSMAQSLSGPGADAGDLDAAARILRAVQDAAPFRPEAALLLGTLRHPTLRHP